MSEILDELDIKVTDEQLNKIVKDFSFHLEMENEMASYATAGNSRECDKCSSLKRQIAELKKEIDVYNNSVKQRRHASAVWIQDGEVKYEI